MGGFVVAGRASAPCRPDHITTSIISYELLHEKDHVVSIVLSPYGNVDYLTTPTHIYFCPFKRLRLRC